MTEAEWLTSDDPQTMLEHVAGSVSVRKLRLFAVSLGRDILGQPFDPVLTTALDAAELQADGELPQAERDRVTEQLNATARRLDAEYGRPVSTWPQEVLTPWHLVTAAYAPTDMLWLRNPDGMAYAVIGSTTKVRQPRLLREILGNPFRPVEVNPSWLTSAVVGVAGEIYDARAFHDLPILADALQDAGCDDEQVLDHCRGPGPHARGCWALDLVLGRR